MNLDNVIIYVYKPLPWKPFKNYQAFAKWIKNKIEYGITAGGDTPQEALDFVIKKLFEKGFTIGRPKIVDTTTTS